MKIERDKERDKKKIERNRRDRKKAIEIII